MGEDVDLVPDLCEGITVTLHKPSSEGDLGLTYWLSGLDAQGVKQFKRCLGDSNGDSTDNVEVYDWDYGNVLNPHLIKLIDATQWDPDFDVEIDGSTENVDKMLNRYPKTQLCDTSTGNPSKFGMDAFGTGYCSNIDPPGFYAVVYYDSSATNPFRVYTRAAEDYSTTTKFYVYTTTGYLNLVNLNAGIFTQSQDMSAVEAVASHYSNIVHLTNTTGLYDGYFGAVDCETQTVGSDGLRDCLSKNDYVMFLNTNISASDIAANPKYPNMYQVKKISRERKRWWPVNVESEKVRNQIKLDYGMNSKHNWYGGLTNLNNFQDTTGKIYRFHPTAGNPDGGYKYAAQCSNRGICNTESGECECFHGYTSDNCGTINALAH